MNDRVLQLVESVQQARQRMVEDVMHLSSQQGAFKPSEREWSVAEVLEHLVLAEQGGINKMWAALDAARSNRPVWTDSHPDPEATIEDIIAKTWQEKEVAPAVATPAWGGPLAYWLSAFQSCQRVLSDLTHEIRQEELETVIYPHYLSGPLNLRQRIEFLRYHIERHRVQVDSIKSHASFPRE